MCVGGKANVEKCGIMILSVVISCPFITKFTEALTRKHISILEFLSNTHYCRTCMCFCFSYPFRATNEIHRFKISPSLCIFNL